MHVEAQNVQKGVDQERKGTGDSNTLKPEMWNQNYMNYRPPHLSPSFKEQAQGLVRVGKHSANRVRSPVHIFVPDCLTMQSFERAYTLTDYFPLRKNGTAS